jgi:signal transduction histidine kinase
VFKSAYRYLHRNFHLSLSAFYFFIPVSILAVPIVFWTEDLPASFAALLLVGILVTALTFIVYWLLITIARRFSRINRLVNGFTILLVTGIARGLITFYLFELLGFQNPTPLAGRIFNSILNVFIWIGIGSILLESNRRFTRRYRALMTQILVLKLRVNSQPQDGFNYIAEQILQMQMRIRGAVKNIQTSSPGSPPEKLLAMNLRKEVEEQLRPLSQRLWVKSIFDPPALRFGSSARTAIKDLQVRFHLIAVIYAVVIILNTFLLTGPTVAISYGALTYIFLFISNQLRKGMSRRLGLHVAKVNIVFVVSVGFTVNLGSTYILDLLGLSHSYSAAILIAPTLSALIITASFIELALADRKTLIEVLTRETRTQDHEYLDRASRGKAASYIHNSLQSELTSLIFQLDSIAANPDPIRSKIIMEKVEAFISRSRSEDFKNYLETPELRLNRVAQSWEGIATIEIAIDQEIYLDQVRASLMGQLIEESIANAVRSGRANKVEISAEFSTDSLKITVRDNGRAPIRNLRQGFGSKWIDSVAISQWALEETDSGRTLTVEI